MHRRDKIFKNVSKITSRIRPNMQLHFCIHIQTTSLTLEYLITSTMYVYSFSSGHHRFWLWWIFVNSQSSKNNRNNISWEKKYDITHTSGNSSKLSANYLSSLWIWFPFHFHSFSLHATMGRGILKVLSPNEYPAICW